MIIVNAFFDGIFMNFQGEKGNGCNFPEHGHAKSNID
jgi:hypothetical protein